MPPPSSGPGWGWAIPPFPCRAGLGVHYALYPFPHTGLSYIPVFPAWAKPCPLSLAILGWGLSHAPFSPVCQAKFPSSHGAKPHAFSPTGLGHDPFPSGAKLQLGCLLASSVWPDDAHHNRLVLDRDHWWDPFHEQTGHCPSSLLEKKVSTTDLVKRNEKSQFNVVDVSYKLRKTLWLLQNIMNRSSSISLFSLRSACTAIKPRSSEICRYLVKTRGIKHLFAWEKLGVSAYKVSATPAIYQYHK